MLVDGHLTFHGGRMYSAAARLKVYEKSGTFPKVTKAVGLASLKIVLDEDAVFPATKSELIEKQGWKVFYCLITCPKGNIQMWTN